MASGSGGSLISCKRAKADEALSTALSTSGKFVWHEQVSSEPEQAQDFYTRLFGWGAELTSPARPTTR